MASIADDIRNGFKTGSLLTRLIYINVGIFVAVNVIYLVFFLLALGKIEIAQYFAVPSSFQNLIYKPWTLFTYMFYHEGLWHVGINMLIFYFSGRIFQDLLGEQRLMSTYIMGGLAGAFLFMLMYNLFPVFENVVGEARAIGASASIMAILVAIATKVPNYVVGLFFFGAVRLKYIALVFFVLDIITIPNGNAGGHIAHIGGAIFGYFYIKQMEKGRDWSLWYFKWANAIKEVFRPSNKKKIKVVYKNKGEKKKKASNVNEQEMVDQILDKISKSGYDSLSKEEKDILFRASQKN